MRNTSDHATSPAPAARDTSTTPPGAASAEEGPGMPAAPAADTSPRATARTPDEYDEMPGSHRRPSDGAALDVGG